MVKPVVPEKPVEPEPEPVVEPKEPEPAPVFVRDSEPAPQKLANQREAIVSAAKPADDTVSLGALGPAIGGGVGGLLFILAMIYVACQCWKKKKSGTTRTPGPGEADTNQTKVDTTMNASKMGLFDGKTYDTENTNANIPFQIPPAKAGKDLADVVTQNNSSVKKSSSPGKTNTTAPSRRPPVNHEDVGFEIMEFDENDLKSVHSYKPQLVSRFGSPGKVGK